MKIRSALTEFYTLVIVIRNSICGLASICCCKCYSSVWAQFAFEFSCFWLHACTETCKCESSFVCKDLAAVVMWYRQGRQAKNEYFCLPHIFGICELPLASLFTGYTQKNGAVSKVKKKFIADLTLAQRTPSAVATVQVSHGLITVLQCVHPGSHDTHAHGNEIHPKLGVACPL
jgi:hypothetical protein